MIRSILVLAGARRGFSLRGEDVICRQRPLSWPRDSIERLAQAACIARRARQSVRAPRKSV